MEKSLISMNQGCSSRNVEDCSEEESGWTLYFEDFLCNNENIDKNHNSFFSASEYEVSPSFSLVSDAASSASAVGFSQKSCKKLKKRRSCITNKASSHVIHDDSLEDTASSPVSSPKVCNQENIMMSRKEKEYAESLEEKGGNISSRSEYTTELKKRGLCLVPVSTFANYIG